MKAFFRGFEKVAVSWGKLDAAIAKRFKDVKAGISKKPTGINEYAAREGDGALRHIVNEGGHAGKQIPGAAQAFKNRKFMESQGKHYTPGSHYEEHSSGLQVRDHARNLVHSIQGRPEQHRLWADDEHGKQPEFWRSLGEHLNKAHGGKE